MSIRNCQLSVALLLVFGTGVISRPAEAAGLIGSTLEWQYYAGGGALPNNADSNTSGSFVDMGSGTGGTFIEPLVGFPDNVTVFNIDATDSTITFDYSVGPASDSWSNSPLSLAPTIDNGIAVNLYSAGTFLSVSIDPATNMPGFVAGDLSFTGNQIQVNWANLAFTNSTMVTLDVTLGPPSVPEPGTILLCLTSGVFLFWKVTRSHQGQA